MTKRKLRKELSELARKSETVATLYSGSLGIYIGGTQYVDVPNRPGFVYVRLRNNISELIQAHNEVVSPVYGLPVLLIRNKTYYEIYGRDSVQYGSYWDSNSSYLPKHGHQHEFDPDNNGGGDLVFVHGEQFYPMMTFPSGSDGSNTVLIAPYHYFYSSAWHYTGNTGVGNLLTYGPTGANNAKLLLVGVDATTGNPFVKQGSEFSEGITGAAALTTYVPTSITPSTEIPGAIIRLVTGTETITWANIYDARQYMGILQAAGGATDFLGLSDTPNSYAGQADKLVVVNAAENALEFRANTGSFGGGGGGGSLGIYGQDEAVGLGTGTTLNVVGSDISLSISGTVLTLLHSDPTGTPHSFLDLTDTPDSYSSQGSKFVAVNAGATALEFVTAPAGGGGGSGLVIYDDSVYKVTGTAISFDSNLSVAVTGSVAFVSATNTTGIPINGWISNANTWSYLSSNSPSFVVSVNANITGSVGLGNRIWLNHLSQDKYFIVTGESVTGSTTYFNLYGGTDYSLTTGTISNPYYSPVKAPIGFPLNPTKWTVETTDTSSRSQGSPTTGVWYNLGSISINIPIGIWDVYYSVMADRHITATAASIFVTLSTANNSESDTVFTSRTYVNTVGYYPTVHTRKKILSLSSSTTYYLNTKWSDGGSCDVIYNNNDSIPLYIRAVCMYL